MAKFAVIIPGAGKGERFGATERKTFAKLDGRPIFLRTLEHFINREDVCQTIFAVAPEDMGDVKQKYGPNLGFMGVQLVEGGDLRVRTVKAALAAVSDDAEYVAVHDAVRPCVTEAMIDAVFAEAVKSGAAILGCPITATIKRTSEVGIIEETIPRCGWFEAQTPQVFRKDLLLDAMGRLSDDDADITDEASALERANHPVRIVESDATNLKITTKGDLAIARSVIKARPAKTLPKLGAFEEAQW